MGISHSAEFFKALPTYCARYVKRRARRFNVVVRTEKYLEKMEQTPQRAPTHEMTMKQVEELMKVLPEKLDELTCKDEGLMKNLEQVFVKSQGENIDHFSRKRLRNVARPQVSEDAVPEGRYNAMRVEHFLCAHARDPNVYSTDVLASIYKVDEKAVKNIIRFVRLFHVAEPMTAVKRNRIQEIVKESVPKDMFSEPEIRVMERKLYRVEDKMAKLYGQSLRKRPDKLVYDMNLFEKLVHLKPFSKRMEKLFPNRETPHLSERDNVPTAPQSTETNFDTPYIPESGGKPITPEMMESDLLKGPSSVKDESDAKTTPAPESKSSDEHGSQANASDDASRLQQQRKSSR